MGGMGLDGETLLVELELLLGRGVGTRSLMSALKRDAGMDGLRAAPVALWTRTKGGSEIDLDLEEFGF